MLELGKRIRMFRQQKGWSQVAIAQKIGLSPAAFSKIEKDVTDISISRLTQLSEILEIPLGELILGEKTTINDSETADLKATKAALDVSLNKIVHLQEYIITLYEQLHQTKDKVKDER
jgi:transcriptional regulator with XRE-family HTH domain